MHFLLSPVVLIFVEPCIVVSLKDFFFETHTSLIKFMFFLFTRCTEGYMGQRCEYKDLEGSYLRKDHFFLLHSILIA